jgi:hypothetical protein
MVHARSNSVASVGVTEMRKRRREFGMVGMDGVEFARVIKVHATSASRRGVVAGLSRGLVGALSLALVGSASDAEADAKGKRKRRRKKRRKTSAGAADTPTGPSTPATGPGSCLLSNTGAFEFTKGRMAQTFLPPKGGQLTEATIYLVENPSFSLMFEIRKVNAWGEPTNTVLASEIVSGIPATSLGDPPQAVIATFATPATLTLGQPYALAVRGPGDKLYYIAAGGGPGDGCPDGQMFRDEFVIGDFVALAEGTDMAYALTIV